MNFYKFILAGNVGTQREGGSKGTRRSKEEVRRLLRETKTACMTIQARAETTRNT